MRIRLFADIEIDPKMVPKGHPKTWNWHQFLRLLPGEKIHVYGAEEQVLDKE